MAISTCWDPSPVTRPAHSPSIMARPSSFRPSSEKNEMAESRDSTTMPTLSIRLRAIPSPLLTSRPALPFTNTPLLDRSLRLSASGRARHTAHESQRPDTQSPGEKESKPRNPLRQHVSREINGPMPEKPEQMSQGNDSE